MINLRALRVSLHRFGAVRNVRGGRGFPFLVAIFAFLALPMHAVAADELVDLVEQMRESVVAVGTFDPLRQPSMQMLATGFVIGDGEYVATNHHVVISFSRGDLEPDLVVFSGRGGNVKIINAEIASEDQPHDVAILRLKDGRLNPVRMGSEEVYLKDGTEVAITGYPIGPVLGLFPATHRGIVAAVAPNRIPQAQASDLSPEFIRSGRFLVYQLDIVAFPGNSGSPLYDTKEGVVYGIINSTFVQRTRETVLSNPSGISYAIPVRYIQRLLRKLESK